MLAGERGWLKDGIDILMLAVVEMKEVFMSKVLGFFLLRGIRDISCKQKYDLYLKFCGW